MHLSHRTRSHCAPSATARIVALSLCAALAGACASSAGDGSVVEYAARDLRSDAPVDLESLRGAPVLLSTWATWCEPCKKEMPELQALWEERQDTALQMVAVNVNASGPDERRIEPMAEDWGLTMAQWRDADNEFTSTFDGLGVPMTVLLDADGRVLETWHGAVDPDDDDFVAAIDDAVAAAE
jgi:cytochrome c-type biogenesis protein